jgi:very-short-patch-repair endonuclease
MGVEWLNQVTRINPEQTKNARNLRTEMTLAERKLWHAIRGKQIIQCRFRRQHPIGPYIADFACVEGMLVVELDGGQHQEQSDYDLQRTRFMQSCGWRVLRFWNNQVFESLDGVLSRIAETLTASPPSQPSP